MTEIQDLDGEIPLAPLVLPHHQVEMDLKIKMTNLKEEIKKMIHSGQEHIQTTFHQDSNMLLLLPEKQIMHISQDYPL